jgi:hypothetical protein
MNWLRRIDQSLFAPPHTFASVLPMVALQLGLVFEPERGSQAGDNEDALGPKPLSDADLPDARDGNDVESTEVREERS